MDLKIALIFHFLLACWPKTNIVNRLQCILLFDFTQILSLSIPYKIEWKAVKIKKKAPASVLILPWMDGKNINKPI